MRAEDSLTILCLINIAVFIIYHIWKARKYLNILSSEES